MSNGRWPVAVVGILLALAIAVPLDWGLPSLRGWAPDELDPLRVSEAARRGFSEGWFDWYPPLHYQLLTSAGLPVVAAARLAGAEVLPRGVDSERGWRHAAPSWPYQTLFLLFRAVSLAMCLGMLAAVYVLARQLAGHGAARWAVAALALNPLVVYYGKLANVEVPYTFWFSLALLAYFAALRSRRLRDLTAFAACAALAVATKDQAFALFVLPGAHLLLTVLRSRGEDGARHALAPRVLRVLVPTLVALALLLLAYQLPSNLDGVRAHFDTITGPTNRGLRMAEPGLAGGLQLLALSLALLAWSVGPPATLAAVVGWWALHRGQQSRWKARALLLPGLSYYVAFLAIALVVYDRYLFPLAVLTSIAAGVGVSSLLSGGAARRGLGVLTAGLLLSFGAVRAAGLDAALWLDSRYRAETYLARNAGAADRVLAIGPLEYLPRLGGLDWEQRAPLRGPVQRIRPRFLVLNGDVAAVDPPEWALPFYRDLESGVLGYERVLQGPTELPWPLELGFRWSFVERYSNLSKVNPDIRVYRRRGDDR